MLHSIINKDEIAGQKLEWIFETYFSYNEIFYFIAVSSFGDVIYQNSFIKRRINTDLVKLYTRSISLEEFPYTKEFVTDYVDIIISNELKNLSFIS